MVNSGHAKHGWFANPSTGKRLPDDGSSVVCAEWCGDGTSDMVTTHAVLYVDPKGRRHYVPAAFRINGLSNPMRLLWAFCHPYEPLTRDASVVHDYLCVRRHDWVDAAWVFYHAMMAMFEHAEKCSRWNTIRAWARWAGVRYVGIWFQRRHHG